MSIIARTSHARDADRTRHVVSHVVSHVVVPGTPGATAAGEGD
ncbi:hypothetical protein [Saccharopolyspora sp. ASAGF58]|nr:hypothetical protein [Saccharopolyspora sp. ASAGF58]